MKIVSGRTRRQPIDDNEFTDLSGFIRTNSMQLTMSSSELANSLWTAYGWAESSVVFTIQESICVSVKSLALVEKFRTILPPIAALVRKMLAF